MYQTETTRPARVISVLVVEDDVIARDLLTDLVESLGFRPLVACNGADAMERLELEQFDLVLLDLAMPDVDGFQVLQRIKSDLALRGVPVLVLSGISGPENVTRCIELGAEDFLGKPVNLPLLKARIHQCLEHKRLYDLEQEFLHRLEVEQEHSERLLLNVLPAAIAERLKRGENHIAEQFREATVLFSDLVGFSHLATQMPPADLVNLLNQVFSFFDDLAEKHGLEKIKTIGDAYMVVGGVPNPRPDHAQAVAEMALDMREALKSIGPINGNSLRMRIGINTGPVVAGIIGQRRFSYDLWGKTVNLASRMESLGRPGCIQVGPDTYAQLKDKYFFEPSAIDAKGIGLINSYLLMGRAV